MEQLWRAIRYNQISDEEPNLAAHWRMGCMLTSDERSRPNLTANNIFPAAQLSLAITQPLIDDHSQPFHNASHQKFSSMMPEEKSIEVESQVKEGRGCFEGHRFNLLTVALRPVRTQEAWACSKVYTLLSLTGYLIGKIVCWKKNHANTADILQNTGFNCQRSLRPVPWGIYNHCHPGRR